METFLISIFGESLSGFILALPIEWGVILTILGAGVKYGFPYLKRVLKEREEKFDKAIELMDRMADSLHKVNESLLNQNERHSEWKTEVRETFGKVSYEFDKMTRIEGKIETLIGDSRGSVDENLALKYFASDLQNKHMQFSNFYRLRCRANHFKDNEDIIVSRYVREAERLGSQHLNMMQDLNFRGTSLDTFWGGDGCYSYFRHIGFELFGIHSESFEKWESMTDRQRENLLLHEAIITEEDLKQAFERNISKFSQMFRTWLSNGKTYNLQKQDYDIKLMTDIDDSEIEIFK